MILYDAATLFIILIDRAVLAVQLLAAAVAFVLWVVAVALGLLIAPGARTVRRAAVRPAAARRRPVASRAHTERYKLRKPHDRTALLLWEIIAERASAGFVTAWDDAIAIVPLNPHRPRP
ncbi:hypothetical protein AB0D42_25170 [Streptomyces sp. NPDC048304]|uniref:hypothetical protein n=1 Tax=Streptomyces sp. NPDC048304 TaxID=3154820 RepID=UPI003404783D